MTELNLQVISNNKDGTNYLTDFKEIIEQRRLIKTRLKLLQIAMFDQDIKKLLERGLTIYRLGLEDCKLTHAYYLDVPVFHKIIQAENDLKVRSYFIYLSYLYNFDFISLYEKRSSNFYKLITNLALPYDMKKNLMNLLGGDEGNFFSSYLDELNSPESRNRVYTMSKTLHIRSKIHS